MLVGGDFYDLFQMSDGNWKAVIGDVSGKGVEAAALMGFVRFTLRAVSRDDTKPSQALHKLNVSLREEIGDEMTFCTAAIVRIHPHDDGARLTIAVAGHPLPYAIRADGTVEPVGETGALLGFLDDIEVSDTVVDLRAGDSLVLLTDGVLECSRDPAWADEVVPGLLSLTAGMRPDTVVDLLDGTVQGVEDRRADDIALLVLHLPLPAATPLEPAPPTTPRALVLDEALRIVDANASAFADLGYGRHEIAQLHADDLVIADERVDGSRRLIDPSGSGTTVLRRRDGASVAYAADTATLRTADRVLHLATLSREGVAASG
jgi:hypothetical protein